MGVQYVHNLLKPYCHAEIFLILKIFVKFEILCLFFFAKYLLKLLKDLFSKK